MADARTDSPDLHRVLVEFFFTARRFMLETGGALLLLTALLFFYSPDILSALRLYLGQKLVFFGVMEPVVSLLKLSLFASLVILAPWLTYRVFSVLKGIFGFTLLFSICAAFIALLLFYGGMGFCLAFTLPFAVKFLLGYQSEHLRAVISLAKFVDFSAFFMLGFGFIFQLPLIMTILSRTGLVDPAVFARNRRYAVLVIAIAAAMLTPTPDVFNMSLMGIPLYLLYESGVLLARLSRR